MNTQISSSRRENRENRSVENCKSAHDDVARRAYQLWEAAGRPQGKDMEYWLQAEAEIRGDRQSLAA